MHISQNSTSQHADLTDTERLQDSRLSRADITQRLDGIAALNHPSDRYRHHDGSIWNGYGELDLGTENAEPAAISFWIWIIMGRYRLFQEANYALVHSLDPVTGLPMEQAEEYFTHQKARFQAAIAQPIAAAYIVADRVQERLDWYREFDIGSSTTEDWLSCDTIEEMFAQGADPDLLCRAGILSDDDRPVVKLSSSMRLWSVWADDRRQDWYEPFGTDESDAVF
jgi:hypothetical protein